MITELRDKGEYLILEDGTYLVFAMKLSRDGRVIDTVVRAIVVDDNNKHDMLLYQLGLENMNYVVTNITKVSDYNEEGN